MRATKQLHGMEVLTEKEAKDRGYKSATTPYADNDYALRVDGSRIEAPEMILRARVDLERTRTKPCVLVSMGRDGVELWAEDLGREVKLATGAAFQAKRRSDYKSKSKIDIKGRANR